jgi:hypothetical protein
VAVALFEMLLKGDASSAVVTCTVSSFGSEAIENAMLQALDEVMADPALAVSTAVMGG